MTRGGTKQLSVFCHMKPPRNTYVTESVDPAAMGVSSFCRRQIFTATSLRVDAGARFSSSLFPRQDLGGRNRGKEREREVDGSERANTHQDTAEVSHIQEGHARFKYRVCTATLSPHFSFCLIYFFVVSATGDAGVHYDCGGL